MANLYKKPVVKKDPKTGETIKSKSKKWWGRFRSFDGTVRRVPLATDKAAAEAMLKQLTIKEERKAAGLTDPFEEHAKRLLSDHLADYRRHLESKENAVTHVRQSESYIRKIVAGCSFKNIREISASRVSTWLADLRKKGKGHRTSNAYLVAIKGFTRWMVRDRRALEDALAHLSALNTKTDIRRERRTLEPEEIALLIKATRTGTDFRGLSGEDRAVLYHVAVTTGLRASELASLTSKSFDLSTSPPMVTVEAAYSKHRRQDSLPLRTDVADVLRRYLATSARAEPDRLWPGSWSRKGSAIMIRKDLKAAGIPYQDESGRVFDFHSWRHQFISSLARSGAHPKEAQALARHSTITLTMDRYTHLGIVDLTSAIEALPTIGGSADDSQSAEQKATGTDGHNCRVSAVPTMVPRGAENGALRLASSALQIAPSCTTTVDEPSNDKSLENAKSPDEDGASRAGLHRAASGDTKRRARGSNPQPVTRHLISSQAASHSLTLRGSAARLPWGSLAPNRGGEFTWAVWCGWHTSKFTGHVACRQATVGPFDGRFRPVLAMRSNCPIGGFAIPADPEPSPALTEDSSPVTGRGTAGTSTGGRIEVRARCRGYCRHSR